MKFRKTPSNQRQKYTYYHEDGSKCVLEVGKATTISATGEVTVQVCKDITEVTIKNLHLEDDRYVESNYRYVNAESYSEKKERQAKSREWKKTHNEFLEEIPYSKPKRNISFDFLSSNYSDFEDEMAEDKSNIEYEAVLFKEREEHDDFEDAREKLRAYVSTLPNKMQELYSLYFEEEYTQAEIAKLLNCSKSTISERLKRLEEKTVKHFKQKPEL